MTLLTKIQTLLNHWFPNKEQDQINFEKWLNRYVTFKDKPYLLTTMIGVSDLTSLYLEDTVNPITHNCKHSVTYDSATGYTQIRINEGTTSNTGSRYYMTIPFMNAFNHLEISVDFYTTNFGNDDFGIRLCDKEALDNGQGYHSYGAWIITGQGRLAYGYGGRDSNSVMYGDRLGNVRNNIHYNYTMKINDTTAYYCIKNLDTNAILSEKTYTRTDSYNFSGKYYLYIGGGKFSTGNADKSAYVKNLTIKEWEIE